MTGLIIYVFNAHLNLHLIVWIANAKHLYNHQDVLLELIILMSFIDVFALMKDLDMTMVLFVLPVMRLSIGVKIKEYADNVKMEKFMIQKNNRVYHVQVINQLKETEYV